MTKRILAGGDLTTAVFVVHLPELACGIGALDAPTAQVIDVRFTGGIGGSWGVRLAGQKISTSIDKRFASFLVAGGRLRRGQANGSDHRSVRVELATKPE